MTDHVAIMNKSWHLIPKIVSGEKTIESRWYQTKRAPWNKTKAGDTVYFKDAGCAVAGYAKVSDVLQFSFNNEQEIVQVLDKYAKQISLINPDIKTWHKLPKYCLLIFLKDAKFIEEPFNIDKKGFGIGTAWLVTEDIKKISVSTGRKN